MIRCDGWSEPVVLMPPQYLEDPTMVLGVDGFTLYYSRGPSLQDQRVYCRYSESPIGPIASREARIHPYFETHTRIERARVSADLWLHTASWPGPPTGGIMAFARQLWGGVTRSLVLTIQPGTGWSFIAANPCVEVDAFGPGEHAIIFEGCVDRSCDWHLYLARWRVGQMATVEGELFRGANPSLLLHEGRRYLYYSALTSAGYSAGFETRVVSQPA